MKTWHYSILSALILTGCLFSSADEVQNPTNYSINQPELVTKSFENVSQVHLSEVITKLSSFTNRSVYTQLGVDSFVWIADHLKELTKNRTDVDIKLFEHKNFKQPTIILTIKGSDPVLQNEIIILSAHGDTTNSDTDDVNAVAPGADDNASGVATISEVLRRLVELDYKPQRTLQFIVYAAEEISEKGSYEVTRWYRENKQNVIGVINYDQTNYKTGPYDIVLIGDWTSLEQNAFIGNIIDTYLKVPWTTQNCGYQCSDHAAWHIYGYPASLPFESYLEGENPNIHTHKDDFASMGNNSSHAALFTKLGLAFVIELDK